MHVKQAKDEYRGKQKNNSFDNKWYSYFLVIRCEISQVIQRPQKQEKKSSCAVIIQVDI